MNINKHPILKQAYELYLAIEDCGYGDKFTIAVTKAYHLGEAAEKLVDRIQELESQASAREKEWSKINTANGDLMKKYNELVARLDTSNEHNLEILRNLVKQMAAQVGLE